MNDQTLLKSDTRKEIDRKLVSAGWVVQDKSCFDLYEGQRVASMIRASTPFPTIIHDVKKAEKNKQLILSSSFSGKPS